MGHINVLFKDIPECMHVEFECSEGSKLLLDIYLKGGHYKELAEELNILGVEIWMPFYVVIESIGLDDGVLLCRKGEEGDRLGDGTLWLPDAK